MYYITLNKYFVFFRLQNTLVLIQVQTPIEQLYYKLKYYK